jgi:DDE superfamily endonuclease
LLELSTAETNLPKRPLLRNLLALLADSRPSFGQARVYARAQALVFGQLLTFGRHTITQSLVALGLVDDDWSSFYRLLSEPRLDIEALRRCLFRQTLAHTLPSEPYVVAVDGVQVPRHSRTMPGTSWLRAPRTPVWMAGIHRAQRFGDLAWLTPTSTSGYSRAIPLWWEPALPQKAVRPVGVEPRKEWEVALESADWLRRQLDAAGRQEQRLLVIGDGSYDTLGLWQQLPPRVVLLVRTARNRVLCELPQPLAGRGRPRQYGPLARKPREWLGERQGWREVVLAVRGREVPVTYRVEGPYLRKRAAGVPVFLIVVRGIKRRVNGKLRQREPTFWLVSALWSAEGWTLPMPAVELLGWAWQRWEIEVTHRACKAEFGVGEVQCWGQESALLAVEFQVWVVSLLLLSGYRAWGLGPGRVQPPGRWWTGSRRWSFGRLWQGFRQEVWGSEEFRRVFSGTSTNWYEKEGWLLARQNAIQGARRA